MASIAFSTTDLQGLIAHNPLPGQKVLTAYLGIDQSRAANLNRGYLRALKDHFRSLEHRIKDEPERASFNLNCTKMLDYVTTAGARGRTLVLISDVSKDLFWNREFFINLEPQVRWDEKPYLRPLIEAVDEYERYAVVLVDRKRGRLFTGYLGQVEEQRDVFSPEKRKYFKGTGKDTTLSQPNFQRHEEEHALHHLKGVAAALETIAAKNGFDRLILAGAHEITNELRGILSKRLQALVVRELHLPMDASEHVILKETMRVEEEVERDTEVQLVEQLITAASKDSHGVLGLQPTLGAMRLGRIMRLVYVQDMSVAGSECPNCASLFEGNPGSCPYDGARPLRLVTDIVDRLADLVVDSGARAENVRGAAADRLREAGRIGGFLRF